MWYYFPAVILGLVGFEIYQVHLGGKEIILVSDIFPKKCLYFCTWVWREFCLLFMYGKCCCFDSDHCWQWALLCYYPRYHYYHRWSRNFLYEWHKQEGENSLVEQTAGEKMRQLCCYHLGLRSGKTWSK